VTEQKFTNVSIKVPNELFVRFADAVLRQAGPKRKTSVIIGLMRAYVDASHSGVDDIVVGQAKDQAWPASSDPVSVQRESNE
jgi:hypothetical protein